MILNSVKKLTFFISTIFCLSLGIKSSLAQVTKQIKYLSGMDNIHSKTWDFWVTSGRNSGYWTKIQVPSHWEQQGFGSYNFGRDNVNYGKNFRFADEKGMYKYRFTIPENWKRNTINLVFEGVMTDTEVKINGKLVGPVHQGGFYRFKYEIGSLLKPNQENDLEVKVSKMSADNSVNNAERLADYWIFGGIYRPVYLEALPKEHIISTSINAKADGSFTAKVSLKNVGMGRSIITELLDKSGEIVATVKKTVAKGDTVVMVNTHCLAPKLWTAETPNLYSVRFSVATESQKIYQTIEKFGFRTIEVRKQDGIYVNGKKIKLKGVNRHVWWPETGRSINKQIDIADVELIKGMNMNAVRTAHYPPDQTFLQACDSLGLYVIDELAGWQKAYSTKAGLPLVKEMVTRDSNHPSILFWSNGNEGGHNFNLDNEFRKYDISDRTVIHAHHKPGNAINGIDCNHYEDYYSTEKILADTNIYMPTEFLHSLDDGGAASGLSDLWDLHWNSKNGAGGFIWALLDEGIVRTDLNNVIDVNGVNGRDGIVGPHREKEGSYYAIKEIYSPVRIELKKLPTDFDGQIPVENRYNFTNLNQCSFKWQLVNFKTPTALTTGYTVAKSGNASAPTVEPFKKGMLKLDLPTNYKSYDALYLTAHDPFGKELYQWSWKTKDNNEIIQELVANSGNGSVLATETDSVVTVKAGGISISISKLDGTIARLANDVSKPLPFGKGPVLVSGKAKFTKLTHHKEGDSYIINCSYEGDLKFVKWKILPSGWVEMNYSYSLDGAYSFAGISFSTPENDVFKAKWLGNGPYRVWKNRPFGTTLNVWENMNNNTQTGKSPWIYPEFKGYFADITWMELSTVNGKFIVATTQDDLFVRLFDFYAKLGADPSPILPTGDISFLDAIPVNGAAGLGPMSKKNEIHSATERTLYFYFGTLKNRKEENVDRFPD